MDLSTVAFKRRKDRTWDVVVAGRVVASGFETKREARRFVGAPKGKRAQDA